MLDNITMKRLRELRLEHNLTQKELAKNIGSTDKNIWAYEKGNATPPADVLISYAKFFNVTVDYLLGLEDDFGAKSYNVSSVDSPQLTSEERQLVEDFRKLNFYKQQLIKSNIQAMLPADSAEKSDDKRA